MSEARAERRRSPRYPASLVVEMEDGKGVTRNVSALGVYLETRERPTMEAPIPFTLILEHAKPTPIRLACVGSVVRVEPHGDGFGIALAITSHGIESSSP
jgi:PilZ domain